MEGNTPIAIAVNKGRTETVRLLLQAGADPNVVDTCNRTWTHGQTPLHTAAIYGELLHLVPLLLDGGADRTMRVLPIIGTLVGTAAELVPHDQAWARRLLSEADKIL